MGVLYAVALAISITGMVVLDRRFGLFFWRDARRAAIVLASGVAFFLVWDLFGIGLGIFFRGETEFMTGLQVAPELPVEEIGFLTLLCYLTMNVYAAAGMLADRWSIGARSAHAETTPVVVEEAPQEHPMLVEEALQEPSRNQATAGLETRLRRSSTDMGDLETRLRRSSTDMGEDRPR